MRNESGVLAHVKRQNDREEFRRAARYVSKPEIIRLSVYCPRFPDFVAYFHPRIRDWRASETNFLTYMLAYVPLAARIHPTDNVISPSPIVTLKRSRNRRLPLVTR